MSLTVVLVDKGKGERKAAEEPKVTFGGKK